MAPGRFCCPALVLLFVKGAISLRPDVQRQIEVSAAAPQQQGTTDPSGTGASNFSLKGHEGTLEMAVMPRPSAERAGKAQDALRVAGLGSAAASMPRWGDATWKEPCWGEPDPEQQLNGDVLQSICARLHQNASLLVFGLGRDSKLWYQNAINKDNIFFLENHPDWLQFQDDDVRKVTRIVEYTSDAAKYETELQDQTKLAALHESLPAEIKRPFDMILVDSPMGMEVNSLPWLANTLGDLLGAKTLLQMHPAPHTPGRTQSIFAAKQLSHEHTLVYVDDFHRAVEQVATEVLLQPNFETLKVFSSGHRDNNGVRGKTAMLLHKQ